MSKPLKNGIIYILSFKISSEKAFKMMLRNILYVTDHFVMISHTKTIMHSEYHACKIAG